MAKLMCKTQAHPHPQKDIKSVTKNVRCTKKRKKRTKKPKKSKETTPFIFFCLSYCPPILTPLGGGLTLSGCLVILAYLAINACAPQ